MEEYHDYTCKSTNFVKSFLHNNRFKDAISFSGLNNSDVVLDYGCGDGHLLDLCLPFVPDENLHGFDPVETMYQLAVKKLKNKRVVLAQKICDLRDKKFSKIFCLETCEHVPNNELMGLLENIDALLEENGEAIFSVPIEIHVPALLKNTYRFIAYKFKVREQYNNFKFNNVIKAIFGLPIYREAENFDDNSYFCSHIGFDYREFEKLLANYFKIKSKIFSPVNYFGPFLNNVVFYKCVKK